MPVTLEFDTQVVGVDGVVEQLSSIATPIEEAGTAAEKVGGSGGGIGGFAGKLTDLGGKALSLVNPIGLLATGVTTLGPKLLDAGRAADAENTEIAQLTNTVTQNAIGWDGNTQALDDAIAAGQRKAFGDSELRASLGQLVTDTRNVDEAIRLQGLAMDLAASKGIPLATATNLVGKADDESYAALAKMGIEIDKTASREEALEQIHVSTAGAAEIFANSTEGASIRASAAMDDALETIGGAVAPGIQAALGGVADFLSGDTFQGAVAFVSGVLTDGLGAAMSFVQSLIGPLQEAVQPLITAILNLGSGSQGTTGLMDGFRSILSTVSGFIISNVIPIVGQIATFLAQNLPGAIQFASDAWTNVLQPALATVWNFVSTVVFPLAGQLLAWLQTNLPPAIQGLANFWTGVLQPALAQAWAFIQTNVIPIFQQVATWLQVNLPPAIQFLVNIWNTVLLPALQGVWNFIQTNLIPLFLAVGQVTEAVVGKAVTALAGIWQNVLQPALAQVWGFIQTNLLPILETLVGNGINLALDAARTFASFWQSTLAPAINAVASVIQKVIDFLNELANKIGSLDLPDWLTPGSPTPWEIGLRGVASAMQQLSRSEVPALAREMAALPTPNLGTPGDLGAAGGALLTAGGGAGGAAGLGTFAPTIVLHIDNLPADPKRVRTLLEDAGVQERMKRG